MGRTSVGRAAFAALLLVACGGSDSGGSASSAETTSSGATATIVESVPRPPVFDDSFSLAMAYDRINEVVVAVSKNETWLFDVRDDTWTKAAAPAPSTAWMVRLVYSPVFGSVVAVTSTRAVLTYDVEADTWAVAAHGGGSSRLGLSLVGVDEKSGDLVILEFLPKVTAWRLDTATGHWVEITQSGGGPTYAQGVGGPVMAYDEVLNGFVVLCYAADMAAKSPVWLFDARTGEWRQLESVPPMLFGYGAIGREGAFVASTGKSVFTSGGVTAEYDGLADVWTLFAGGRQITGASPRLGEPENFSPAVVYDPVNGRLLSFGGMVPAAPTTPGDDDMWAYDPVTHTWTQLLTATP